MVNVYDIGDTPTARITYTNTVTGAVLDPTTVSLTVKAPDGTTTTYTYAGGTITRESAGVYSKVISATMAGTYNVSFTSTGTGADCTQGSFQVRASRVS